MEDCINEALVAWTEKRRVETGPDRWAASQTSFNVTPPNDPVLPRRPFPVSHSLFPTLNDLKSFNIDLQKFR